MDRSISVRSIPRSRTAARMPWSLGCRPPEGGATCATFSPVSRTHSAPPPSDIRERGGSTLPAVFKSEAAALGWNQVSRFERSSLRTFATPSGVVRGAL